MKRIESEVLQTLRGEASFLFDQIRTLDKKLSANAAHIGEHAHLVTAAYHLSGIYSCLEDIFSKIAKVFENRIENPASWHKELLERMRIEVPQIRPAVVSEKSFAVLDEMRGFCHVFRSSYVFQLDRERVQGVAKKWQKNRSKILQEIKKFLKKI